MQRPEGFFKQLHLHCFGGVHQFKRKRHFPRRRLDDRKAPVDPFRRRRDGGGGGPGDLFLQETVRFAAEIEAAGDAGGQHHDQQHRVDPAGQVPVAEGFHGFPPEEAEGSGSPGQKSRYPTLFAINPLRRKARTVDS
ncbi:hypothetical protein SDC9_158044 [bioreactor metagenome]|uniref:Uncharacterized protein n=1 Tax=bioreactor metagenome TaxID=1076179 RepID=A0A645F944_9ZZZZ